MSSDKIVDGVVVAITYVLTVDGQLFDRMGADRPFEYLHGRDNIISGLEKALSERAVGDVFSVTVEPRDGYGLWDEELVERIPRSDFDLIYPIDSLVEGQQLKLIDDEENVINATILEFNRDWVVMDCNPILAGKTLEYQIEVLNIRKPTEEEIKIGEPLSLRDSMTFQTYDGYNIASPFVDQDEPQDGNVRLN